MKKLLFVALAAGLMLTSVAGCKKKPVEPKDFTTELAKIVISSDDCAKVNKELVAFLDLNGAKFKEYLIAQLKDGAAKGVDYNEVLQKSIMPSDAALKDKSEKAKCQMEDPAMKPFADKFQALLKEAGEAGGEAYKAAAAANGGAADAAGADDAGADDAGADDAGDDGAEE